jgi:hypothetical protein
MRMRPPIVIGSAVCVAAGFFFLFVAENHSDDDPAAAYSETAINRVKATIRDPNAKFENVLFHPMAGPGPDGRSYVCGYAKSSTDKNAKAQRFIYYFGLDTVSIIDQLRDSDHGASAALLCNAAPLALDKFDLSEDRVSLKTK